MTTVAKLCEQVLFGETLADKLVDLGKASDTPDSPALPQGQKALIPGRPDSLKLGRPPGQTVPFPRPGQLYRPNARGQVFHFFANHELLALELMALFLLRFPDAPKALRAGMVATMTEEQEHFRLYHERLEALGGELGEIPVNQFFWDHISPMGDPLFFLAAMGLTFEQANLDYATYFAHLFGEVEDPASQTVMQQVYEDELRHVGFGLAWFQKLRPKANRLWQEYRATLPFPLTPTRGKGLGFSAQGFFDPKAPTASEQTRLQLGFDENFVRELRLSCQTKGRPPRLWVFDPEVELRLGGGGRHNPVGQQITADLASLMGAFAADGDLVWVPKEPSLELRERLFALGFPKVEYAAGDIPDRKIAQLGLWSADRDTTARWRSQVKQLQQESCETKAALFRKTYWVENALVYDSHLVTTMAECQERINQWQNVVFKSPYGVSGRGQLRQLQNTALTSPQQGWLEKTLRRHGNLVAEPWHKRVFDISCQGDTSRGEVTVNKPLVGLYDGRGRFWGHRLHGAEAQLAPYGEQIQSAARTVGEHLLGRDCRTPFGIDGYVYDDGGTPRLRPICEVNPRYTMGHIAGRLRALVAPGPSALWLLLTPKELPLWECESFADFSNKGQSRWRFSAGKLSEGLVCLTDVSSQTKTLACLFVGEPAEQALEVVRRAGVPTL